MKFAAKERKERRGSIGLGFNIGGLGGDRRDGAGRVASDVWIRVAERICEGGKCLSGKVPKFGEGVGCLHPQIATWILQAGDQRGHDERGVKFQGTEYIRVIFGKFAVWVLEVFDKDGQQWLSVGAHSLNTEEYPHAFSVGWVREYPGHDWDGLCAEVGQGRQGAVSRVRRVGEADSAGQFRDGGRGERSKNLECLHGILGTSGGIAVGEQGCDWAAAGDPARQFPKKPLGFLPPRRGLVRDPGQEAWECVGADLMNCLSRLPFKSRRFERGVVAIQGYPFGETSAFVRWLRLAGEGPKAHGSCGGCHEDCDSFDAPELPGVQA